MHRIKKHPMFPVFVVVFFGYVGFSLAFPVFSPMFLNPASPFLPLSTSLKYRTLLLGFTLAAYPAGQIFGLPLLGKLSDTYGRKKILTLSLSVSFLTYITSALGIRMHSFWLLLLSRFVCGYAEGNFSIAQSTAADISSGHQRVKNFGIINMAASLGFVIGPVLGGQLADPDIVSWFSPQLPFWFSALLALFTIVIVFYHLPETKPAPNPFRDKKLHPFSGIRILYDNFSKSKTRGYYFINFLFYFGLFFFYQFYPVLLVTDYAFDSSEIADMAAYVAVILAAAQLLIVRPLAKRFSTRQSAVLGAFLLGPTLIALTVPYFYFVLFFVLPAACIAMAIATTNLQSLVSHSVSEELQGEVMGVNYSMQIFGEILTCLIGGFLAGFFIVSLPLIVGGSIVLLSAFGLQRFTSEKRS